MTLPRMREMSVTEQRYKAVLAVIADGRIVTEVAKDWGVSRQTMHGWLARYEEEGLEGLNNRSHRPAHSPHQMPAVWEAKVLETRRAKPYWGARRLALELTRKGGAEPALSESAVYRCLVRAGVIEPQPRRWRRETWKRWERAAPMELWQLDTVGGFLLADGTTAKALTGVDDHSRYCVSARLMARERTQSLSIARLWRWVRGRGRVIPAGVGLGLVAWAIGKLGVNWIRCSNVKRIGRRLCGPSGRWLADLLEGTLATFVFADLCRVILVVAEVAGKILPPLIDTLARAEAALCGGRYSAAPALPLQTTALPDVANPLPLT